MLQYGWVKEASHKRLHTVLFTLYELSGVDKYVKIESTLMVVRTGEGVSGEQLLMGLGFLFGVMERFWYLIVVMVTQYCKWSNVNNGKFYVVFILSQLIKDISK